MKRISLQFAGMLTALFLFAFSCQDHYVPEEPEPETPVEAPKVKTVALSIENQALNQYRYKLNVESLGNIQITGFGVVYSAEFDGNAPFTNTPTIADNKVVFPMPIAVGEKSKVDGAPLVGYKTIYYRAYVTYGVNSVAYGDVMQFSPVALKEAKISTLEIMHLVGDGQYRYRVAIETLGDVPINEYGTLVTFKMSMDDNNFNSVPVVDNYDKKLVFLESPKVGELGLSLDLTDETASYYEKYYRAYAILANGSVVYGEVRNYE